MLFAGNAQDGLSGKVIDKESKEPLPFVSIVWTGTHKGTVTNLEGSYVLGGLGAATPSDSLTFSYIGYKTHKVSVSDLGENPLVSLEPAPITLAGVQVLAEQLSATEILERVRANYAKNHPQFNGKRRIFYHKYGRTPFPEGNKLVVKKSDFVGLDPTTIDELFELIPDELSEYQDAVVDVHSQEGEHKLVPVQGVSLEEGSAEALAKQAEDMLEEFFTDFEKTSEQEEVYYKFRTGIFGFKIDGDSETDSLTKANRVDSIHYVISTKQVKGEIVGIMNGFADKSSKNWEFINKPNRYQYTLGELAAFGDELVYTIHFTPESRGLFEGTLHVSTATYGILQLNFAFAEGKQTDKFQLLGFGHAINGRQGRVVFEKTPEGYFVKYINAQQEEFASVDRSFVVKKKKKRFLFDKELTEIKMKAQLTFDSTYYWEILVMDRTSGDEAAFEAVEQPFGMRFKKEYSYNPTFWQDKTILAPVSELEKYTRSENELN